MFWDEDREDPSSWMWIQVRIFPHRVCADAAMARSKRNVADVKRARNIASHRDADHRAWTNGERLIFNRRTASTPARERHAVGLPVRHARAPHPCCAALPDPRPMQRDAADSSMNQNAAPAQRGESCAPRGSLPHAAARPMARRLLPMQLPSSRRSNDTPLNPGRRTPRNKAGRRREGSASPALSVRDGAGR